jgi:hypothetical protein
MSFEGYYRRLCVMGHLHEHDVYWPEPEVCPECKEPFVWFQIVNQTNGSFCENPESKGEACEGCEWCKEGRIDGYIELEVLYPAETETCECCGHVKELAPIRYKIPG